MFLLFVCGFRFCRPHTLSTVASFYPSFWLSRGNDCAIFQALEGMYIQVAMICVSKIKRQWGSGVRCHVPGGCVDENKRKQNHDSPLSSVANTQVALPVIAALA